MFKVSLSTTLQELVSKEITKINRGRILDNSGYVYKKGFCIQVYLEVGIGPKKILNVLNFIFAGNINVWYYHDKSNPTKSFGCSIFDINPLDFVNSSNHPSCWRFDGIESMVNKIYFEMCNNFDSTITPAKIETSCKIIPHITKLKIWYKEDDYFTKIIKIEKDMN